MADSAQLREGYGTLVYSDHDSRRQEHVLAQGRTVIGRGPGAGLRLDGREVAEAHAAVVCTPTGCYLVDLGSPNPTHLTPERRFPGDDEPVRRALESQRLCLLHDNDLIAIGRFELRYRRRLSSGGQVLPPEIAAERWRAGRPMPVAREEVRWLYPIQQLAIRDRDRFPGHAVGLTRPASAYLRYLPPLYQEDDIVNTFLLAFEAILGPIEHVVDHMDAYLHPALAPASLLPWLAAWVDIELHGGWPEGRQRRTIAGAARCYALRGTRQGLEMLLRLFIAPSVEVDDSAADLPPGTFRVTAPEELRPEEELLRELIEREKPAHTRYELRFRAS